MSALSKSTSARAITRVFLVMNVVHKQAPTGGSYLIGISSESRNSLNQYRLWLASSQVIATFSSGERFRIVLILYRQEQRFFRAHINKRGACLAS